MYVCDLKGYHGNRDSNSCASYWCNDGIRFVTKSINALGHTEQKTYRPLLGMVTLQTGPNGLTTSFNQYDGFGRNLFRTKSRWYTNHHHLQQYCGSCPAEAEYYVSSVSSGSAPTAVYYDMLGREVQSESTGDGTKIL